MIYDKVDTKLEFAKREAWVRDFWKKEDIATKALEQRKDSEPWTFYDGPPTANGQPHIGHVLTRVIKDLLPRFWSMKGRHVLRKAGWDTHGLPVELEVEKALGISGKDQIETYGIEPFIKKCRESVWKYKAMWEEFSDVVGFWADMEHPYITYENYYIESEWWALKEIWKRGLLYRGHRIVPYCPRCGTPLSSHEVAQGYKDVTERSAMVKFKCADDDAYYLAWTTTPWTLPSNLGLCVHPDVDYVKLRVGDTNYILAAALVDSVFDGVDGEREVLAHYKGRELEHRKYEPLYEYEAAKSFTSEAFYVTCDEYVTTEEGTGIVHIAPAFGEDDNRICKKYGMPFVQFVDGKGLMTADTKWPGVFVKDADPLILKDLRESGKLFKAPKFTHSYPFCWRCDTPLLYYARESWFIKMTAVRDELIECNNTVNWVPPTIGKGRFGDWIEHVQDWNISRNRYWGTPLNIWVCGQCGHEHSVGSIAELRELSDNCPKDIELHRPYIDAVTIKCEKCGGEMRRVPEVIDCWFDSGAMPFAQWHYPFENKALFGERFPADFISEAVDQTRGWFYSLIAESTLLFHQSSYKNVIVMGHVQDKDGQKMSKSKGNAVDPMTALKEHGADAIRWYFYVNSAPWLPSRFHDDAVREVQRKFMGTLWNTYAFYVLYANIDNFDATAHTLDYGTLSVMDRWILSRLQTTVAEVDADLTSYKVTESAKALQEFVDELSNWYVRRSRERFWATGDGDDKINAYLTLYTALVTIAKAAAPLVPFITENIYQNLVRRIDKAAPISVHLCDFPAAETAHIDAELEADMETVRDIVNLGRAARNAANLKTRQPLATLYVKAGRNLSSYFRDIVRDELNVKMVEFKDDMSAYLSYSIKPQFAVLGKKVGKLMKPVQAALKNLDGHAAKVALDTTGKLHLDLGDKDGTAVDLTPEDVDITMNQTPGYACQRYADTTVAVTTALTPELLEEGLVRELISKVQTMRRDANFEVTDHIVLAISGNDKVADAVKRNMALVKKVTLAANVTFDAIATTTATAAKTWNLNGEDVALGIAKV